MHTYKINIDGMVFETIADSKKKAINNCRHQYAKKYGKRIQEVSLLPTKATKIQNIEYLKDQYLRAKNGSD